MTDKVFSWIKDRRSYLIQKSLYKFVNDKETLEKMKSGESIHTQVQEIIWSLSNNLVNLFKIDISMDTREFSNIAECFEMLISKSLHNQYVN